MKESLVVVGIGQSKPKASGNELIANKLGR